jgi:hypothetical protein
MVTFKVEAMSAGDFERAFPHKPADLSASIENYLKDRAADGHELVGTLSSDHEWRFVFRSTGSAGKRSADK